MSQHEKYLSDLAESFVMKPRVAFAKRFNTISFKILLRLESELLEIESRGFQDMPGDATSTSLGSPTSSQPSSTGPTRQAGGSGEQLATFDEVRKKMETYQDFLLRFIKLYSLKPMDYVDRNALHHHLANLRVSEIAPDTWSDTNDLVGVCTTHLPKRDRFTEMLIKALSWIISQPLVDKLLKGDDDNVYANEETIASCIVVFNVCIASLINMMALFVLYAIHSTLAKIGTICAFSMLFMLSGLFFTGADPIMVYSSTAAYSAVLVVFIGNVN
ncbi:uncharacterized protein TRUGW13939_10969 [Talaromyces rugulosus]|uniref:DUF6594 domain-containing protein n=1 Tax=Talaromyces rugulosus TaxID=121627 RepID=A0A7H8RCS2_TALRU|nr:uncharacterized protein TRUGW13939_10969 [Talaromyces rugulosus]QKX63798.1 hypothetical protein TRUGW13939_10969 [Talaromyces rugulosus]